MTPPAVDRGEVARTLRALFRPGDVFEVRAPEASNVRCNGRPEGYGATFYGYFDNFETAVNVTSAAFETADWPALYLTMNPVNPDLFARAANRIKKAGKKGGSTPDGEVPRRRYLLVDVDPQRPAGISSSEDEKAAAEVLAHRIRLYLVGLGWPEPVVADSGNGWHLLFRLDLPGDDGGLVEKVLVALAARFDTEETKVDTTVFNPARITKLYGTMVRKGDSTPDRPHRPSRIVEIPDALDVVPEELLRVLAAEAPAAAPKVPARSLVATVGTDSLNLSDWITRYTPHAGPAEPWQGGSRWIVDPCVFNPEHRGTSAAIVRTAAGVIAYTCQHNGCRGRTWHDVREMFEPAASRGRGSNVVQISEPPIIRTERIEPEPENWPAPLDPVAYHGLLGRITRAIEPHTEADPIAVHAHNLVLFGNAVGHGPHFRIGATRHHTVENAILVGISSKARKGTSKDEAARPYELIEDPWLRRIASGLSTGEGLLSAVRDPLEKSEPIRDGKGRHGKITGYETVVVDPGEEDKRQTFIESEYGRVLRVMERDGSTLSSVIRQVYDCPRVAEIKTRVSPIRATDPHVSIIGHITRDELVRYLDRTDQANGFANRFLYFLVRRSKELPNGGNLTDEDVRPLAVDLQRALETARQVGRMTRTRDAQMVWETVYGPLSQGRDGIVGGVTNRAEAHVLRISMIYALADGLSQIDVPHLEAALALWTYALESAECIFGSSLGNPDADEILRNLRLALPAGLTRTELHGCFGRNLPEHRLTAALDILNRRGLARGVREIVTGRPGRPTERWYSASPGARKNDLDEINAPAAAASSPAEGNISCNSFSRVLDVQERVS